MTELPRTARPGARREIPWGQPQEPALDKTSALLVGRSWEHRMRQEHLAVGAFSMVAQELAEEGCDSVVLSLVTRASTDEVEHAEICRRLAARHLGEAAVAGRLRGVPRIPAHEGASPSDRVLFHMVEMCCLSESATGVFLTEMLSRATDVVARAAIESLLEDEIDHGKVGWAYLAARVREGSAGALAQALPSLVERVLGRHLEPSRESADDDPRFEAHGYLGRAATCALYREVLSEVSLPGFEAMGIDLTPTLALCRAREWLAA